MRDGWYRLQRWEEYDYRLAGETRATVNSTGFNWKAILYKDAHLLESKYLDTLREARTWCEEEIKRVDEEEIAP